MYVFHRLNQVSHDKNSQNVAVFGPKILATGTLKHRRKNFELEGVFFVFFRFISTI